MADPHPGASPYSLWKNHLSLAGNILAASFLYILLNEKKNVFISTVEEKKNQLDIKKHIINVYYTKNCTEIFPDVFNLQRKLTSSNRRENIIAIENLDCRRMPL